MPSAGFLATGATWTYRADVRDIRPVARTVELVDERPEDLAHEPAYRGTHRRYAQLRYGSENSRRVIVVVDELDSGDFDLYVDRDRDRTIASHERIAGTGRKRQLELDSEIVREDTPQPFARQIELRRGFARDRLSIATLGGMLGQLSLISPTTDAPTRVAAERVDGDANGLFADARDRLRVDLNADGQFDAVTEQFAWLPVQTLGGRRYAVKADRQGASLSLDEITGTGNLQVTVARLPEEATIVAFEAMVFSDDGSAWSLSEADKRQEVPVGRYALGQRDDDDRNGRA